MTHPPPLACRFAVIGTPIGHSYSPFIHNQWLAQYHHPDSFYEALEVTPSDLPAAVERLRRQVRGFNVTLPLKEAILPCLDDVDARATRLGAVNTVSVRHGKLYGTNTDGQGWRASLQEAVPSRDFGGREAVLLGAGGAARSILDSLTAMGCSPIKVINRTADRAHSMIQDLAADRAVFVPWSDRAQALGQASLVVNATHLGMEGCEPLHLSLKSMPTGGVVSDLVYTPRQTDLLRKARALGHETVEGVGMLLHQAAQAFFFWTGQKPEISAQLRAAISRGGKSGAQGVSK